ncbi:hypothetical protein HYALB_00007160 [Hymenoscyphus albidus]|uniref:Uncharacterized protein n=1 Tax=Hymenoscyphus albidus TaxID=595503 RepID=A0A9N9Q3R3_9HELO|nr:hypothetical protein HYALB_00007160 [Hymenoscyphus albidus]
MVDIVKRCINPQLRWKGVNAMGFFGGISHRVASRIFVGEELCQDERFLETSQSFLNSIFMTALVIVKLPLGPFRQLFCWPLSRVHAWRLRKAAKLLLPEVKKRMQLRMDKCKTAAHKLDAIEWTLDFPASTPFNDTPEQITTELLYGLWAGSSVPGGMLTEIVYQLLLLP